MDYELKYMRRCIQLARCGEMGAAPNPMVGAVVVHEGRIIGEGFHRKCGGPHAEVNAIASVRRPELLKESTIYVSLEPCAHYGKTPPCADLIIEKGIPRVVIGCQDPFAKVNGLGIKKLCDAGVEVVVGILEEECLKLNSRFITFHEKKRPWVTLKWAQSQDGFMDRKRNRDEAPTQFSSRFTQTLVHRMRAQHKAIMVGTQTALMDDPTLTVRLWEGENPLRVTVDRHGILPENLNLKDGSVPTCVFQDGTPQEWLCELHGKGIQSLLVEGGARLLQSFIEAGIWDEARVEVAPFLLEEGVPAPILSSSLMCGEELVDGRRILHFCHEV